MGRLRDGCIGDETADFPLAAKPSLPEPCFKMVSWVIRYATLAASDMQLDSLAAGQFKGSERG